MSKHTLSGPVEAANAAAMSLVLLAEKPLMEESAAAPASSFFGGMVADRGDLRSWYSVDGEGAVSCVIRLALD